MFNRRRTGDIGAVIKNGLETAGLAVVRDFVGYTMGRERMREPRIPGYGRHGTGTKLRDGQILHVHVISKHGTPVIRIEDDGWGAASSDGRLSAVFTAMVEVAADEGRVLSCMLDEQPG
jgi:methionyl aminopeptidase